MQKCGIVLGCAFYSDAPSNGETTVTNSVRVFLHHVENKIVYDYWQTAQLFSSNKKVLSDSLKIFYIIGPGGCWLTSRIDQNVSQIYVDYISGIFSEPKTENGRICKTPKQKCWIAYILYYLHSFSSLDRK